GRASAYDAIVNRIAPAQSPIIGNVLFTKRVLTIDGLGFTNGATSVQADGVELPPADYDLSYSLANGTLTRVTVYLGKKPMKKTFPAGVVVGVTVSNTATGERSQRFETGRF